MAKYIEIFDRYFLEPGDPIIGKSVDIVYTKNGDYELKGIADAELSVWVEEDEQDYPIQYALDIPVKSPYYGKPYYQK